MGTGVLADSTLLIDVINGIQAARDELRRHSDRAVSVISWIEVMSGVRSAEEESRAMLFLSGFKLLQLTSPIALETANIRRSSRLKLPDAVLLATAHVEGRVLLTRNTRDFQAGRFVHIPYTL